MEGDFIRIRQSLIPLSWLYGSAVGLRNFCFDVGLLKSRPFQVPVIAVGNITVGGTGKTPHVEFLIRLLSEKFSVAVLSRGYKRKTSGFLIADGKSTADDVGDEPCQMKHKFPDVTIAVDKKRVHGIEQLTGEGSNIDVVLLDDAFQHRYVKPGVNILLVDYHRLIIYDRLLPAGRLREPLSGKNRADIVIVTKCPRQLKPMEFRVITKAMNLYPYQHLYFTTLDYGTPQPVFPEGTSCADLTTALTGKNVLMLTGIASPEQLKEDLKGYAMQSLQALCFADHHSFKKGDISTINDTFHQMASPKIIITTEKDATRLTAIDGLSSEVRQNIHALPVSIAFMQKEQEQHFSSLITGYVMKNSRHSTLNQREKPE